MSERVDDAVSCEVSRCAAHSGMCWFSLLMKPVTPRNINPEVQCSAVLRCEQMKSSDLEKVLLHGRLWVVCSNWTKQDVGSASFLVCFHEVLCQFSQRILDWVSGESATLVIV